MSRNLSRRASDGRRAVHRSRATYHRTIYTNGITGLALVKNDLPSLKLVQKTLVLIPGVCVVHGSESPLLGGIPVTLDGQFQHVSRADLNCWLVLRSDLRRAKEAKTPPAKQPESVYLLPAVCESSRTPTPQVLTSAAA